ncbi:phage baseplate assembly protein V [Desulfoluna butyratoxydans]|uniref:Phage baseplate assembly protein v/gp45 n=1 Tax=Desulfoluna butyratoxydans TaxID=231438 RepID=A0A4U8YHM8_9BACT|nr:phage baseplate assembly protein V [Desulfoluna butyratoxydans]VFQ42469.1 phage baseplate assembly protein v/gp45 [Desulfoluna butyratoxydans]
MMTELEYRIAELERRLRSLLLVGTVQELDEKTARVRVASGGIVTDWLPWLTRRAGPDSQWWAPEPGEQVMLLCPCGDPALGVALPGIPRDAFPAPADVKTVHRTAYQDGAVTQYDREAHALSATIPGTMEGTCNGDASLTSGGKVTVKGSGGIIHDGDGTGACLGTVNGHCLCPFTGTPHVHVSASVTSTK